MVEFADFCNVLSTNFNNVVKVMRGTTMSGGGGC